ncbi:MAG: hypothetical protein OIF58_09475 [Cohaesibacter sp.]|nr:hypothetical protein [Cohaesibacter sp.]
MATKNEAVTASFHFLTQYEDSDDQNVRKIKFSQSDFASLLTALQSCPKIDIKDESTKDDLRFRSLVPIERVTQINSRTIHGVFKASYWGHAYENSDKGTIPADSISLRPFHFILYLSETGKIYIGSQYLGPYGGYTGLKNTIVSHIPSCGKIRASSFRLASSYYKNAHAKEVRVSISKQGGEITSSNIFARGAMVAFKKISKHDGFEEEVSRKLLDYIDRPKVEIKKAVASVLKENQLIDVEDEDIVDCSIVAMLDGKRKVIHMLESGHFATRFALNVGHNKHGHPEFEPTKSEMLRVLENEIIARKEDV